MSAASHLRVPVTGSAVPDDLLYNIPAPAIPPRRRGSAKSTKKAAKAHSALHIAWMGPMLSMGLCAAVCLAIGLGLVAQKARLMTLNYQLIGLQAQLAEIEKERNYLQLALMQASSPAKVEQAARERLGMVEPNHMEYLVLEGADTPGNELSPVVQEAPAAAGPVAAIGRWLTANWPRWGRAEASPRQ